MVADESLSVLKAALALPRERENLVRVLNAPECASALPSGPTIAAVSLAVQAERGQLGR